MSKKSKHAKQRLARRKRKRRQAELRERPKGPKGESLELVQFEIIREPMDDPTLKDLSPQELDDLDWASHHLQTEPQRCIEILEPMIENYPDIPKLYNHLAGAYLPLGRQKEVERLVHDMYRRFPKYLFGRINYAMACIREKRTNEIPTIFENRFSLHQLYPERRGRFHISEFAQFNALMGYYMTLVGKFDVAKNYYEMVKDLDYDHYLIEVLGSALKVAALGKLFGFFRKRPPDSGFGT